MGKRKNTDSGSPNSEFCDILTELAEYEKNVNRDVHKYSAYRKAANILAKHPTALTSGSEARKLEGIGPKIAKKLDEYLATGTLKKLEAIRGNDKNKAITELTRVSGIGPAKAIELSNSGITNLDELRKHPEKLTHHQLIGLKYVDDFEKKVPREEIQRIEDVIIREAKQLDEHYDVTICGSYRRGKPESGDIDALVTHKDYVSSSSKKSHYLTNLVSALEKCGLVKEKISLGDVKFMGACQIDSVMRRLDIRLVPYDQYYCAILYFTGSDVFNRRMRTHALQKGYTLNEYSLRRVGSTGVAGEVLPVTSERDIFDYIDFPYKEPHERES